MGTFDFKLEDMPVSTRSYEPLAPGWYDATVKDAQLVHTRSGDGQYLKLRFVLQNNRNVFANITIKNASATAERIGSEQIGDIMRAAGIARLREPHDLLGQSMQIKLEIQPASERYEAQNVVLGYKALKGSASVLPMPKPAVSSDEPIDAGNKKAAPPWLKK